MNISIKDKITKKQTPLVMVVEIVAIVCILLIFSFSNCSQYKDMEKTAYTNMMSAEGMRE